MVSGPDGEVGRGRGFVRMEKEREELNSKRKRRKKERGRERERGERGEREEGKEREGGGGERTAREQFNNFIFPARKHGALAPSRLPFSIVSHHFGPIRSSKRAWRIEKVARV